MPALFKKVQFETHALEVQREFYACSLGLPLVAEGEDRFAVQAGSTELEFVRSEDGDQPLYHFAFNIPENQIAEALMWTRSRTSVPVKADDDPIYDFFTWNAHAFYFCDPAGNLLEFIARHTVESAGNSPFTADSILCVSEVGIATSNVRGAVDALSDQLAIRCYPDPDAEPGHDFQALGDEEGLFVVAKTGRTWLGSEKLAQPFPTRIWTTKGGRLELPASLVEIC